MEEFVQASHREDLKSPNSVSNVVLVLQSGSWTIATMMLAAGSKTTQLNLEKWAAGSGNGLTLKAECADTIMNA